jgi:hypothetical protein
VQYWREIDAMTHQRDLKLLIRLRMEKTGESYSTARAHLLARRDDLASAETDSTLVTWNPLLRTTTSEAKALIKTALASPFFVTHDGLGITYNHRETPTERRARFDSERASLVNAIDEVAASADWIKNLSPIKSFNRNRSSYGYKHMVERWFNDYLSAGKPGDNYVYVANGSFIAAAIGLGFNVREISSGSINAFFNFSERSVAELLRRPERYRS